MTAAAVLEDIAAPGRSCPVDYRYGPGALRDAAVIDADVAWIVGGLYGNTEALAVLQALVARETAARVVVVLNGDFHWFDLHEREFATVQQGTAGWIRLRGNVETELARGGDGGAGCGCAYPDEVPQADVDRSNAIARALGGTARRQGAGPVLGALPMVARLQVGTLRAGVVHGDEESLAGWRLAHDRLCASIAGTLPDAMDRAGLDLLASSHTCLPVADTFGSRRDARRLAVINNGAAGMANFEGTRFGIATRLSSDGPPPRGVRVLYRAAVAGADVAAVAIDFDPARWLRRFDAQWPAGSPAALSYRRRITDGPAWQPRAAARGAFAAAG